MALFGKKSEDGSGDGGKAGFAGHPVFTLTAGVSPAEVAERIGPATETKTPAEVAAEFAGPDAVIDPAKLEPEEYWFYTGVPDGFDLSILFREQRLVEVRVRKEGSQELVARIDEQGVAANKVYRRALNARWL